MAYVNRQRLMAGSAMADALNQENRGFRDSVRRQGGQPKNHMAANVAAMRAAARQRKAAQQAAGEPAPEPFKMQRFAGATAKVATTRPATGGPGSAAPSGGAARGSPQSKFLRRGEGVTLATSKAPAVSKASDGPSAVQHSRRSRSSRKAAVPTREELAAAVAEGGSRSGSVASVDFIKANATQASKLKPPARAAPKRAVERPGYGKVPSYLRSRQAEWQVQAEAAAAAAGDPACPPGLVAMPDEERVTMLRRMQAAEADVKAQLGRLPLVLETRAARRRAEELEAQLADVSEAVAIFSQPKVYVAPE